MTDQPPRRAYELQLTLGADSRDDLCDALRSIADRIDREQRDAAEITGGSPRVGFHLTITYDPTMTSERFHEELQDWVAKRRLDRKKADQ